mgnify:CR=1 FL=1
MHLLGVAASHNSIRAFSIQVVVESQPAEQVYEQNEKFLILTGRPRNWMSDFHLNHSENGNICDDEPRL